MIVEEVVLVVLAIGYLFDKFTDPLARTFRTGLRVFVDDFRDDFVEAAVQKLHELFAHALPSNIKLADLLTELLDVQKDVLGSVGFSFFHGKPLLENMAKCDGKNTLDDIYKPRQDDSLTLILEFLRGYSLELDVEGYSEYFVPYVQLSLQSLAIIAISGDFSEWLRSY